VASADPSESPAPIELGNGPFDLPDPAAGLADLTSYVATLTVTFSGTSAGASVNATAEATMRVSPQGRELVIDRGSDGEATWRAEIGGTAYSKEGASPCATRPVVDGESLTELYEPAWLLAPLFGADEAGTEVVDDAPAHHYAFDRRALALPVVANASGDVWVAERDGHVVRYRMSLDAGPPYFGEGIEGTRSLEYEVSTVNEPLAIDLPSDCPVPLGIPPLPDATDVVRRPLLLSFNSRMSLARAVRTYPKLLRAERWKPSIRPAVTRSTALLAFRKGTSNLTVIMRRRSGTIDVQAVVAQ
jgi:hypothetical protein